MKVIDCRGLPCPQPVINTKNALDEVPIGENILVLVDNEAAVQNVCRFATGQGHQYEVKAKEGYWEINIVKKTAGGSQAVISCAEGETAPVCVVLSSRKMGEGEETLSHLLLKAFIKTLKEVSPRPAKIICYNEGVFLTLADSEVLEDLKELEQEGVEILVCGTCLDYYQVKDKLAVGRVSNMYDILTSLLSARVLKP